jgi:hypothetical protein
MDTFDKFEIVNCGPYRFIGKSVYAYAWDNPTQIFRHIWSYSDWIFGTLDGMAEHASDDGNNAALRHWNMYETEGKTDKNGLFYGKTCLLGYTVGRFMRADCPVPKNMDCIDIPEVHIGKGWVKGCHADIEHDVRTAIEKDGIYEATSWKFMAEVSKQDENGDSWFGYYVACRPMSAAARLVWDARREKTEAEKEEARKAKAELTRTAKDRLSAFDKSLPKDKTVSIDLTTMETKNWVEAAHEDGKMLLTNTGSNRGRALTADSYGVPLKLDLRVKLSEPRLEILFHRGALKFSAEGEVNELTVTDVENRTAHIYEGLGSLPVGEFIDVEWIFDREFTAVRVNGEIRDIDTESGYIAMLKAAPDYNFASPISICCFRDTTVEVEYLKLTLDPHTA